MIESLGYSRSIVRQARSARRADSFFNRALLLAGVALDIAAGLTRRKELAVGGFVHNLTFAALGPPQLPQPACWPGNGNWGG